MLCGEDKILENCVAMVGNDVLFYDGDNFWLEGSRYIGSLVDEKYKYKREEFYIKK